MNPFRGMKNHDLTPEIEFRVIKLFFTTFSLKLETFSLRKALLGESHYAVT